MLIYVIVGVSVLVIVLASLDWQKVFEKLWGNDAGRAVIYVETDEDVKAIKGKLLYTGTRGVMYGYKWLKVECVVCVPDKYPYKFLKGRRMIRVRAGESTPRYWDEKCLSPDGVFSVSALVRSHLVRETVLSMSGGEGLNWKKWLLIVGVACVVGFVVYNMFIAQEVEPALQGVIMNRGGLV